MDAVTCNFRWSNDDRLTALAATAPVRWRLIAVFGVLEVVAFCVIAAASNDPALIVILGFVFVGFLFGPAAFRPQLMRRYFNRLGVGTDEVRLVIDDATIRLAQEGFRREIDWAAVMKVWEQNGLLILQHGPGLFVTIPTRVLSGTEVGWLRQRAERMVTP